LKLFGFACCGDTGEAGLAREKSHFAQARSQIPQLGGAYL
jgi:hypothetical protein